MDKAKAEKHNALRKTCLANAEELLKAANFLLEKEIDHVAFHLSVLALEEIGKIELAALKLMVEEKGKDDEINIDYEDHEKKLFWAIWSPSFGRQKITQKQIEEQQNLAKNIHERRKIYLYVDPSNPISWQEKMGKGESKMLYDFVSARFQLEKGNEGLKTDMPEEENSTLKWFLETTNDPQKRKEIFGNKSQEKLIELGDVKKWIDWLKEVYDKHEQEMRELVQSELSRKKPETEEEARKPKWRIKIKIISPSHSIKTKALDEFNKHSDYIKLHKKDTNTLYVELFMQKAVPAAALWEHGWGMARMFVVAMNIATRGFFWWNVPIDISRYYEEIWDLEKNAGVRVEPDKRLALNWKELRWVLGSVELIITSLVFQYITNQWIEHKMEALDTYANGLSLFAKNDIHLRLELNAFEQFFKSLKKAMETSGDWDGKSDFKATLHQQIGYLYKDNFAQMDKMVDLASEVEIKHIASQPITITEVVAMKAYCDAYFIELAKRYEEKRTGKELKLVVGELADKQDTNSDEVKPKLTAA